jgi:hypothetical protein
MYATEGHRPQPMTMIVPKTIMESQEQITHVPRTVVETAKRTVSYPRTSKDTINNRFILLISIRIYEYMHV